MDKLECKAIVNTNTGESSGNCQLNTKSGHSAEIGVNHMPQHNNMTSMSATANVNLLSSPSGNFKVDAFANGTQHLNGPLKGKSDVVSGLKMGFEF